MGQISGDPKHLAMDGSMVIWDTKELRKVLERHNVKLVLQGHSHRVEDTFWNGAWYVTGAAASGAWWAGSWTGSDPGYTIVRCAGDRVTWSHESYPWEAQLDPQDTVERQKIAEQKAEHAEQLRLGQLERRPQTVAALSVHARYAAARATAPGYGCVRAAAPLGLIETLAPID